MKKIVDSILLEMTNSGTEQKDIAIHFGVSGAAICKRLKRLRHQKETASVMSELTEKQQVFVAEICSGKNKAESALAAFDCKPDTAPSIGTTLMQNPMVQTAVRLIMEENGLTRDHLVKTLKRHVFGEDNQISLRATVEGFKLFDSYPAARNVNVNLHADICPVDLSSYGGDAPLTEIKHEAAVLIPPAERQREPAFNPALTVGSSPAYDPFA